MSNSANDPIWPATSTHSRRRWLPAVIGLFALAGIVLGLHFSGALKKLVVIPDGNEDAVLSDAERDRYKKKLAEEIAELDRTDPGWRLEEIEAARAKIPDAENGALIELAAAEQLPHDWPTDDVVIPLNQVALNRALTQAERTLFEGAMKDYPKVVEQARSLAEKDKGRFSLGKSKNAIEMYFPRDRNEGIVHTLLWLDVVLLADRKEFKAALRSCRAQINVGLYHGDEPLAMSYWMRAMDVRSGCRHIERVLAQGVAPDEDLLTTQRLLEAEAHALTSIYPTMIRGEWAAIHHLLTQASSDGDALASIRLNIKVEDSEMNDQALRDQILVSHVAIFPFRKRELEIARLPMLLRGAAQQQLIGEMKDHYKEATIRIVPGIASGGVMIERSDRAHQMQLRSTIAAIAAERYRQKHGKWPGSMENLKPFAAEDLLVDPADGQLLRLRHAENGLIVYSIGLDGKDDGGDIEPGRTLKGDIGVDLWDVEFRHVAPAVKD